MDWNPLYQTDNQIFTFFDGGGSEAATAVEKKSGGRNFTMQDWLSPILHCHLNPYLTLDYIKTTTL
ncbi:MAG: hypothetical protein R2788_04585 [Saprospiraceae bacterium]